MKISKIPGLGRFGLFVDDLDFATLTNEQWMEIGHLHLDSLVTILRNVKNLPVDDYPTWVKKFGETRYSFQHYIQKKYNKSIEEIGRSGQAFDELDVKEQNVIKFIHGTHDVTKSGYGITRVEYGFNQDGSPRGWFPQGELRWHSNEAGCLTFVPGLALYGHRNMVGSATGFLTTTDYYESLSESFRSELDEMVVIHKFEKDKVMPGLEDQISIDALHIIGFPKPVNRLPLVMTSPAGHRGFHCFPGSAHSIEGLSQQESDRVFNEIYKNLFENEKYQYDHYYQQDNDICLFDNSVTLHRRIGKTEGRLAYRIAYDYTNLQTEPWQPYQGHPRIARQYIREINEAVKMGGITNFRLPGIRDYLRTFF